MSQNPAISLCQCVRQTAASAACDDGYAVAARVHLSAARYGQTLRNIGYSEASQMALIRSLEQAIGEFQPAYLEEMRGIAAGAEVSYEDIVMINARTEVLAKARVEKTMPADAEDEDGCTRVGVAVAFGDRATDPRAELDWKPIALDTGIVLRVRNDDDSDFSTFVEAGGLMQRAGMPRACRSRRTILSPTATLPSLACRFRCCAGACLKSRCSPTRCA